MPWPNDLEVAERAVGGLSGEEFISRVGVSRVLLVGVVGVVGWANLDGPCTPPVPLVGDVDGVVCRSGEGDAGDSALRKGELRAGGDP